MALYKSPGALVRPSMQSPWLNPTKPTVQDPNALTTSGRKVGTAVPGSSGSIQERSGFTYSPTAPAAVSAPQPKPYQPAQVSPADREMQLIEQNAKRRLEMARNQSDMQKAAMLQDVNEQAYTRNIGKDTNAFWKMQQEVQDQAGMQSQNLMNDAFNINAGEMQQEVGQRRDQQMADLKDIMYNEDLDPAVRQRAATEYGNMSGFGGSATSSGNLYTDAFNPENKKSEFAKANDAHMERLSTDFGIQNAPEWLVRATRDMDSANLNRMVQQYKNGTLTESGWNSTQSVLGMITDAKSLQNITNEQFQAVAKDPVALQAIKDKVGNAITPEAWPRNPQKGSVVFDGDTPMRVMWDGFGDYGGQIVQSAIDGKYYFYNKNHSQGVALEPNLGGGSIKFKTGRKNEQGKEKFVVIQPDGTVRDGWEKV